MGNVEDYIKTRIKRDGAIHFTLIDPDKVQSKAVSKIAAEAERAGSAVILLGGSTISSPHQVEPVIKEVKKAVKIPLVLFPGNISGLSRLADAVLFMSLLNSANPYFLIDAQAIGAPFVKRYNLEAISLGYIIMGPGGTAGFIGYARPIPYQKAELAASYALAAQYLGMHFVYLEAGSGAEKPIPPETISTVRKTVDLPIIVGGGIKTGRDAARAVKAGADIIVTGTVVEKTSQVRVKIQELVDSIRR
jgi:phosphoglycerol geranylgeranyltransferase